MNRYISERIFVMAIVMVFITTLSVAQTSKPESGVATASSRTYEDCKACEYFPICKFVSAKTFQGKSFRAVPTGQGNIYYNCDGGTVTRKQETFDKDDKGRSFSTGFKTEIFLKTNAAVGTKWTQDYTRFEVIDKGLTIEFNGEKISDVIVVNEKTFSLVMQGTSLVEKTLSSENKYYAKGYGLLKSEALLINN